MTDSAIAGTRKSAKELVDGTLRVQIDIEPRDKAQFHKLFPEIDMPVALAPMALPHQQGEKGTGPISEGSFPGEIDNWHKGKASEQLTRQLGHDFGSQAKALRLSGFFRTPKVWESVGTDDEFQDWVRFNLKCVVCLKADFDPDKGIDRCEFAHVRRSGEAGTAYKPPYSGVSLCHAHHTTQHNQGESAAYRDRRHGRELPEDATEAREWFDKKRIETVQAWCWSALKAQLGFESWSQLPPSELADWAAHHDVYNYLPDVYKTKVGAG